jgi:5-formyltetrahydrofolate cyclo-ligase
MNKIELRKHLQARVAAMTTVEKQAASQAICKQLNSMGSIIHADSIFVFLPLPDEVDLMPLIELWIDESRTVCVPLINWEEHTMRGGLLSSLQPNDLVTSGHGIKEPKERHPLPSDCIDVIIVPGIGFDTLGGRLGRGGGYYDRFISRDRPPIVIGVCFDEQLVDTVPKEPHDQLMTAVITPTNVFIG